MTGHGRQATKISKVHNKQPDIYNSMFVWACRFEQPSGNQFYEAASAFTMA